MDSMPSIALLLTFGLIKSLPSFPHFADEEK